MADVGEALLIKPKADPAGKGEARGSWLALFPATVSAKLAVPALALSVPTALTLN